MTKTKKATRNKAKKYYKKIYTDGTIYVWGMNYPTIISDKTILDTYKACGTDKYNKEYYAAKLKEGKGKPGSDCSGAHYGLSGYDTTANGYYDRCTDKGKFDTLPIDDIVLLFKGVYITKVNETTGKKETVLKINHTGVYYGNNICMHMKSSAENSVEEAVDHHGWTHWGRADFIDYSTVLKASKPVLTRKLVQGWKGVDVKFLQTMLNEKNYNCGKVDGDFGNKTAIAVKNFQTDNGLKPTGIVDKKTAKTIGFEWEG